MGQIHSIKLAAFAAQHDDMDLDLFKARYKVPFLLVESAPSKENREKSFRTLAPEEDTKQKGQSALLDSDFSEQYVSTVEKSGRNAFKNMVTIGRSVNNDIIVTSLSVSKLHAYFRYDSELGMYTVTDVGSTNGSSYDGENLEPNVPRLLSSRKTLMLGGSVRCTFFTPSHFFEFLELFRKLGGKAPKR